MANLTVSLPAPAGDGVGAAQNTALFGGRRTITCQGTFRGVVTVEVSEDAGVTFAPIWSFTAPGETVVECAGNRMRVRRNGVPVIDPGTPTVDVAAADTSAAVYSNLPVTAGNGTAAAVDTSAMPDFKTITVLGTYTGSVTIQISEDNSDWSDAFTFTPGVVLQSQSITAFWMRVIRSGVGEQAGTPIVNVGAVPGSAGGGGGSSYTLETIEVSPPATVNLADGTGFDEEDEVQVKNITEDVGNITINAFAGQTIDGNASLVVAGPLISIRLNWDGVSNWRVV